MTELRDLHQSQLAPAENKFHVGNSEDGKHYWLTPPDLYEQLNAEFGPFDFDPCPYPLPEGFDGLTCEWGQRNYVNPPFGSIIHQGRKKGPTAWVRKAIEEWQKGKRVVLVYPVDKWVLMLVRAIFGEHSNIRNLGDVRWLATEDGSQGKGTGRHIACFILEPPMTQHQTPEQIAADLVDNACLPEQLASVAAALKRDIAQAIRNERRPSIRPDEEMLAALKHAEKFISNGIELGFIRMPDAGTPDPAHDALPKVRAAIAKAEASRLVSRRRLR